MNITIRLTKVEYEMLKELQRRDKRYKKGLEEKVKVDISSDYNRKIGLRLYVHYAIGKEFHSIRHAKNLLSTCWIS